MKEDCDKEDCVTRMYEDTRMRKILLEGDWKCQENVKKRIGLKTETEKTRKKIGRIV